MRRPVLSASIVKNSSVEENVGKSLIFISLSVCVRARISSTSDNPEMRTRKGRESMRTTHGNWIVDVFRFDNIAQEHRRFLLALDAVVVFKYDTRRVDDPQAALELDRLQLVRVSRLRGNGAHLHYNDARVIKKERIVII